MDSSQARPFPPLPRFKFGRRHKRGQIRLINLAIEYGWQYSLLDADFTPYRPLCHVSMIWRQAFKYGGQCAPDWRVG